MEVTSLVALKDVGVAAALGISAFGSALGSAAAGMATLGAWKKCYLQNKTAPFLLIVYVSAPLSQTVYGMILMNKIASAVTASSYYIGAGVLGGLAIAASAFMQGRAGACAADAYAETGKGFTNYLIILGIIETVAIFVLVLMMGVIK